MAELLKRSYDLLTLKVELLDSLTEDGEVRFTLQSSEGGDLRSEDPWRASLREIGLPRETGGLRSLVSRGGELPVVIPHHVLEGIAGWVDQHAEHSQPLWVHLVKPYGLLRLVPWERLLGEKLNMPILMLPDFIFPPPRETEQTLDIVVCGSAPLGAEDYHMREAIHTVLSRVCNSGVRRMRVHVFVDWEVADGVRQEWSSGNRTDVDLVVHDHTLAENPVNGGYTSRTIDRLGTLRSPWLLWMADALRGQSVDVVHFVCHGYLSRDGGALLFAESPTRRTERYLNAPVGATELQTFFTRVGAWSSVFTAPSDNHSPPGLRSLADEIAQNRPGPLMMHTLELDQSGLALHDGYHFLYGAGAAPVPHSKALFIYCQPYLVAGAVRSARTRESRGSQPLPAAGVLRNEAQRKALSGVLESSAIDKLFERVDQVQSWVASTERFADQVQFELQELAREEVLPERHREIHARVKQQMLSSLREAVAEEAMSDFLVSEGEA